MTGALVMGILGLIGSFFCGIPGLVGIGGILMGASAKKEIKASRGQLEGDGKATAGIVMGSIACAIVLFWFIAFIAGAFKSNDVASPSSQSRNQNAASYPFSVRDGGFQFTVNSVTCSGSTCTAYMDVQNIRTSGSGSTYCFSCQKLIDSSGTKTAGGSGGEGEKEILPGATISIREMFVVATGSTPQALELHDSPLSDGVTVRLPA